MFFASVRILSIGCLLLAFSTAFATESADREKEARQHVAALATKALDKNQQFVLIHMPHGSDENAGARQLAGILGDIAKPTGVFLVIGSEDTSAMAKIVKDAFATVKRGRLYGCVVVFVGAQPDQASVGEMVSRAGAQFRFVEYQP